jgi:hypothetical protein
LIRRRGIRAGRANPIRIAFIALWGVSVIVTQAEEIDLKSLLPLWDHSFDVRTAAGYRDNTTLASVHPPHSGFFSSGLEASVWRLPEGGRQFRLSVSADDRRYFSSQPVDKEQLFTGQAEYKQVFAEFWQASVALEYTYLDQILDVSTSEASLSTIRVQAQIAQGTPGLRRYFSDDSWIELTFPVSRQIFVAPLDSFWEGGPKLTFERPYGEGSEWLVGFKFSQRQYDHRRQIAPDGTEIPGTRLSFQRQTVELGWKHFFDSENRWRASTKAFYTQNEDNGPGFFNYSEFGGAEEILFRFKGWAISVSVQAAYYDYVRQVVSPEETRKRAEVVAGFRCEKQITRWLKLFAEYEHERNWSNVSFDSYSVSTASGGLIWQF